MRPWLVAGIVVAVLLVAGVGLVVFLVREDQKAFERGEE